MFINKSLINTIHSPSHVIRGAPGLLFVLLLKVKIIIILHILKLMHFVSALLIDLFQIVGKFLWLRQGLYPNRDNLRILNTLLIPGVSDQSRVCPILLVHLHL